MMKAGTNESIDVHEAAASGCSMWRTVAAVASWKSAQAQQLAFLLSRDARLHLHLMACAD